MLNILLLEDDFLLAMEYREHLEKCGHTVYHEVDDKSALATLEEVNIDVAVIDILMRDWTGQVRTSGGFTLIGAIQTRKEIRIPIVAISGTAPNLGVLQHAEAIMVGATLEKPIDLEELSSEIERLTRPAVS